MGSAVVGEHFGLACWAIKNVDDEHNNNCNLKRSLCMRLRILMIVEMLVLVFWVMAPCSLLGGLQHFR
jgi:hypothetical protein